MDQHPVPQNISSYEFRLVGDMTLKQFFQLAGGILVAVILFHTNLPFIIKWPLMILGVLVGIMLAFVPVGGRPFSQWLMAFIKAIYSPTQFVWNPSFVTTSPLPSPESGEGVKGEVKKTTPLDKFEQQMFDRFTTIFQGQPVTIPNIPVAVTNPTPVPAPPPPPVVPKHETMMSSMTQVAPTAQKPVSGSIVHSSLSEQKLPETMNSQPTNQLTSDIPVTVNFTPRPTFSRTPEQAKLARFATNMPEPSQANILVGQVSDSNNMPVDGVIIEISEAATDIPVRALRTNRLGQFQIATPLASGQYVLHFEKDGLAIESVSVITEGKIVAPILVVAKNVNSGLTSS